MRPKVLHLIDDAQFGGIQSALHSLVTSRLKTEFEFQIQIINLKQYQLSHYQADILCLHHALSWQYLPKILLLKLCNFNTPLIYQEHHYCHGFMKRKVLKPKRFLMMLKMSYRLMDKIIAVSQSQAQWLIKNNLTATKKLITLGQGENLTAFTSLPLKQKQSTYVFGAYGRLHTQKGFDLLIEAMKLIPHANIELKIAGAGKLENALKTSAQQLYNVHFIGMITDIPAFLSECDAIVIPSRWEPFGLVYQEALAAGKPIIHSGVDGLYEQSLIIDEHHTNSKGLFENSAQSIANALLHCINTPPQTLSQSQRDQLHHRWDIILTHWTTLLKDCLNK